MTVSTSLYPVTYCVYEINLNLNQSITISSSTSVVQRQGHVPVCLIYEQLCSDQN